MVIIINFDQYFLSSDNFSCFFPTHCYDEEEHWKQ